MSACVCDDCGRGYDYDLIVDDALWSRIAPKPVEGFKGGGLLCPECIVKRLVSLFGDTPPLPGESNARIIAGPRGEKL